MIYNLSFQFRQTKLWKKLNTDDVFAVQTPHGVVLCHVSGRSGEEISLVCGESKLTFVEKGDLTPTEMSAVKRSARQNKLKLKDNELYPRFSLLSEEAQEDFMVVLEAAIFLTGLLSKSNKAHIFADGTPLFVKTEQGFDLTTASTVLSESAIEPAVDASPPGTDVLEITDDVLLSQPVPISTLRIMRLKKFPKKPTLEYDIIKMPRAVYTDDGDAVTPEVFFPVDKETGISLGVWYYKQKEPYDPNEMLVDLVDLLIRRGYYPKKIEVRAEAVYRLLDRFCKDAGITLKRTKTLPEVDAAKERMSKRICEEA